jgi:flagellar basal-body rod protein FlgB
MDLQNLTVFNMASKKMSWLTQRQAVLANNIANADTPNYTGKDLKSLDFSKELHKARTSLKVTNKHHMTPNNYGVAAVRTNPAHSQGTLPTKKDYRENKDKNPYEVSIDDNGVVLEEQMVKVNKTRSDYELSTTIYKKHMNMLRMSVKSK